MGPYCDYCGRRCFVQRRVSDGRSMLLATCSGGMGKDFELLGEDHRSAINPTTGRPGYDSAEFRSTARQLGTRAQYLAYGDVAVSAVVLLDEIENLVAHLRRQLPRKAAPVVSDDR